MSVEPLKQHPTFRGTDGPIVLVVMDGVGLGPGDAYDAVHLAKMPTFKGLMKAGPMLSLRAHGLAVGLPSDGDMGNSEVGHNALGSGRVFPQGAKRINAALASGDLFEERPGDGSSTRWWVGKTPHFISWGCSLMAMCIPIRTICTR